LIVTANIQFFLASCHFSWKNPSKVAFLNRIYAISTISRRQAAAEAVLWLGEGCVIIEISIEQGGKPRRG